MSIKISLVAESLFLIDSSSACSTLVSLMICGTSWNKIAILLGDFCFVTTRHCSCRVLKGGLSKGRGSLGNPKDS